MKRSMKCVFTSHCLLAQVVRAEGIVKHSPGPVKAVVQFCLDNDINIIQMPCPESNCMAGGLGRAPHGKTWYERNGLREVCKEIAGDQVAYMCRLIEYGAEILAVIGVEFSPACAVGYLNRGPIIEKDSGIFVEELKRELNRVRIEIPFIGVNERWHRKLKQQLGDLVGTPAEPKAQNTSQSSNLALPRLAPLTVRGSAPKANRRPLNVPKALSA